MMNNKFLSWIPIVCCALTAIGLIFVSAEMLSFDKRIVKTDMFLIGVVNGVDHGKLFESDRNRAYLLPGSSLEDFRERFNELEKYLGIQYDAGGIVEHVEDAKYVKVKTQKKGERSISIPLERSE